MKKTIKTFEAYEAPEIKEFNILVEQGFGGSDPTPGDELGDNPLDGDDWG